MCPTCGSALAAHLRRTLTPVRCECGDIFLVKAPLVAKRLPVRPEKAPPANGHLACPRKTPSREVRLASTPAKSAATKVVRDQSHAPVSVTARTASFTSPPASLKSVTPPPPAPAATREGNVHARETGENSAEAVLAHLGGKSVPVYARTGSIPRRSA